MNLGQNWKSKVFFININNEKKMENFLKLISPPIYRLSEDKKSAIFITWIYTKSRINSFASTPKDNLEKLSFGDR